MGRLHIDEELVAAGMGLKAASEPFGLGLALLQNCQCIIVQEERERGREGGREGPELDALTIDLGAQQLSKEKT